MFKKKLYASWGDMDFNSHMRNTAYLDKAADVRMMFFAEHGFPMSEFMRLKIGPVILKDEIEYFREINLLEDVSVNLALGGLSEDSSRWIVRNEFTRTDGKLSATITSAGGWLNLVTRRITPPPEKLMEALGSLSRTEDFRLLETRGK